MLCGDKKCCLLHCLLFICPSYLPSFLPLSLPPSLSVCLSLSLCLLFSLCLCLSLLFSLYVFFSLYISAFLTSFALRVLFSSHFSLFSFSSSSPSPTYSLPLTSFLRHFASSLFSFSCRQLTEEKAIWML